MEDTTQFATYADATNAEVLANYEAACAAEVACHERDETVPAIVSGAADAWMREGMDRGIL